MEMTYVKVYQDWTQQTKKLKAAEKGRLIDAMIAYMVTGEDPTESLVGNEQFLFPVFQAQIDRDRQELENYSRTQSENGSKGGRPKKAKKPSVSNDKPENPLVSPESQKSYNNDEDNNENNDPLNPPSTESGGGSAAYIEKNIRGMTPGNWEEVRTYMEDGLSMELICHAVDEAAAYGNRNWAYVRGILNRFLREGITNLTQAKAGESKPQRTRTETYNVVIGGEVVERTREVAI